MLGNCSTIISFRVGPNDAPLLGKQPTIGRKTPKNWDWVRPLCARSLVATLKRVLNTSPLSRHDRENAPHRDKRHEAVDELVSSFCILRARTLIVRPPKMSLRM